MSFRSESLPFLRWYSLTVLCLVVFWLGGCAGRTARLEGETDIPAELLAQCYCLFPSQPRQFLHRIDSGEGLAQRGTMLGLTQVDPQQGLLQAILMSPEQVVVFEATRSDQGLEVRRSLPPFDQPGWAEALFADIGLFLLRPRSSQITTGTTPDAQPVCRHRFPDGKIADIVMGAEGPALIREYDARHRLQRQIIFHQQATDDFSANSCYPSQFELTVIRPVPYRLHLKLLQIDTWP